MSDPLVLDTSLAVPMAVGRHPDHRRVMSWRAGRPCVLSGHAVAECFSVLTRLPAELRVPATTVAEAMAGLFGPPLVMSAEQSADIPAVLAASGVYGGAVYDGLVGLAAREHRAVLATRDARAKGTYDALGVQVEFVV